MITSISQPEFATPMMKQYLALKEEHADCLLLFRLGDFYELFLDDAKIAAQILGITLTARSRGKDGAIPMAGVPYHAVGSYISKLIEAGYKVAICDQVSEPSGKGLVDRQVTRIITPGTVLDELSLNPSTNNYLLGLEHHKKQLTVVLTDISTGELYLETYPIDAADEGEQLLHKLIVCFKPQEILLAPNNQLLKTFLNANYPHLFCSTAASWPSTPATALRRLKSHFSPPTLASSNLNSPLARITLAGVIDYLEYTQKSVLPHLHIPQALNLNQFLQLDTNALITLDLLPSPSTHSALADTSLFGLLNTTHTSMGSRLLKKWLQRPLQSLEQIQSRHQAVAKLLTWSDRKTCHHLFKTIADIERLVARCSAGTGTPRQLFELANTVKTAQQLAVQLSRSADLLTQPLLSQKITLLQQSTLETLADTILATLTPNPPHDPHDGDYIQTGVNHHFDSLTSTITTNRQWMANLETQLRQTTSISSLKVRFNSVFGFYIEVSTANIGKVPSDFIRKQTLVNGERYITPEMKEREDIILTAESKRQKECLAIFKQLVATVVDHATALQQLAESIATLDCLLAFAENAEHLNLVQPTMTNGTELDIKHGRHPMVEQQLEAGTYIPNHTQLNTKDNQVLIITGPNMAGKSVYMRQVALLVIMAQMGSFVPADSATVGIVDRIFVRSGAGDQISQGLSTFMVEMVETAFILRNATEKSLVIMDEIGRGTSTYDGISIAQAIAAYLVDEHNPHPKTLFATHYHELQSLVETYPDRVRNVHMAVGGDDHQPVFLYQLRDGGASASFGIAVARLAGLPSAVTNHAERLLEGLTKSHQTSSKPGNKQVQDAIKQLLAVRLEKTTGLDALNLVAKLQNQLMQG